MLDLDEITRIEKVGCPGLNDNWLKGDAALTRTVKVERLIRGFANISVSSIENRMLEVGKAFVKKHTSNQI